MTASKLDDLKTLCVTYSFDDIDALSSLLCLAISIFPGLNNEISKYYAVSLDTVSLWIEGAIIPDEMTQRDIVKYVYNKACNFRDAPPEENHDVSTDMIVYNSTAPARYIPEKIPVYQPAVSYLRSAWNTIKAFFYTSDVSIKNLDSLIDEAKRDKEAIFHVKLNRKIAKSNKMIVKAVRKNRPSVIFNVGPKTIESVRLANAVKAYYKNAGFNKVEVMFEYSVTKDGDVFVEINLQ